MIQRKMLLLSLLLFTVNISFFAMEDDDSSFQATQNDLKDQSTSKEKTEFESEEEKEFEKVSEDNPNFAYSWNIAYVKHCLTSIKIDFTKDEHERTIADSAARW